VKRKPLTRKQKIFVKEYLSNGGSGKEAALSAGYSKNTATRIASENLKKPCIARHVKASLTKIEKRLDLSAEKTISDIAAIANSMGEPTAVRLKALELLGKTQRIFVERHEVDVSMKLSSNIEEIFDSLCILVKLKEERNESV